MGGVLTNDLAWTAESPLIPWTSDISNWVELQQVAVLEQSSPPNFYAGNDGSQNCLECAKVVNGNFRWRRWQKLKLPRSRLSYQTDISLFPPRLCSLISQGKIQYWLCWHFDYFHVTMNISFTVTQSWRLVLKSNHRLIFSLRIQCLTVYAVLWSTAREQHE